MPTQDAPDHPTWVYHPKQEAKIVQASQAKRLYRSGWYDTPAKFPKPETKPETK